MAAVTDEVIAAAHDVLGINGVPWDNVGDYFSGEQAWRDLLLHTRMQAIAAFQKTGISIDEVNSLTEADALASVVQIWQRLAPEGGAVLELLKTGDFSGFWFMLPKEHTRTALLAVYAYNRIGTNLHFEGAFARGIDEGRISISDAEDHLDRCVRIWQAFASLGERGVIEHLVPKRSTSGLGEPITFSASAIVLIVLVAAVAAAAVLGVTLLIGLLLLQKKAQERAFDECDLLLKDGQFEAAERCRQQALDASNEAAKNGLDQIMAPLRFGAWILGIGAVIWIGANVVLPAVMSVKSARRTEARA